MSRQPVPLPGCPHGEIFPNIQRVVVFAISHLVSEKIYYKKWEGYVN